MQVLEVCALGAVDLFMVLVVLPLLWRHIIHESKRGECVLGAGFGLLVLGSTIVGQIFLPHIDLGTPFDHDVNVGIGVSLGFLGACGALFYLALLAWDSCFTREGLKNMPRDLARDARRFRVWAICALRGHPKTATAVSVSVISPPPSHAFRVPEEGISVEQREPCCPCSCPD